MSLLNKLFRDIWVTDDNGKLTDVKYSLLFYGDILADRNQDGLKILDFISKMREYLESQGCFLEVLAWNHDEYMLWFLANASYDIEWLESLDEFDYLERPEQLIGIKELSQYGNTREEILRNMQNDTAGYRRLQEMTRMRLARIIWDTIHFHTPPSKAMLDTLQIFWKNHGHRVPQETVQLLNKIWKEALGILLLYKNPVHEILRSSQVKVRHLGEIFLHTLNGSDTAMYKRGSQPENHPDQITPIDHPYYVVLGESGISTIYHGHATEPVIIPWMQVVSLDQKSALLHVQR